MEDGIEFNSEELVKPSENQRSIEEEQEEIFNYWNTGGPNGPTGHGDICFSDADEGL